MNGKGDQKISKENLIEKIKDGRGKLEAVLAQVTETEMHLEVEGGWALKDHLAHISAWERRLVERVQMIILGETLPAETMDEDFDAVNAIDLETSKDTPVEAALVEFKDSFQEVIALVEDLAEEVLVDASRYTWQGKPLWMMIAGYTWGHYQEHQETLQGWVDETGRSA